MYRYNPLLHGSHSQEQYKLPIDFILPLYLHTNHRRSVNLEARILHRNKTASDRNGNRKGLLFSLTRPSGAQPCTPQSVFTPVHSTMGSVSHTGTGNTLWPSTKVGQIDQPRNLVRLHVQVVCGAAGARGSPASSNRVCSAITSVCVSNNAPIPTHFTNCQRMYTGQVKPANRW